ncbi:MAG: histidine kinase, partial [bacterium]|nr:histidine kinase [bacterium]
MRRFGVPQLNMRVMVTLLLILLLPTLSFAGAQDKNTPFTHYALRQGLSQVSISSIKQDHYGFMWFATDNGLNKYDGYTFTVYEHTPGNPLSLSDSAISSLHIDKKGNIWVGTRSGGLNSFDRRLKGFHHYMHDAAVPHSISQNVVSCIYENPYRDEEILWVGTGNNGLNRFDVKKKVFKSYKQESGNPNSLSSNTINAICAQPAAGKEKGKHILWIGTNRGLDRFDIDGNEYTHINTRSAAGRLSNPYVKALLFSDDDTLWIATWGGGLN